MNTPDPTLVVMRRAIQRRIDLNDANRPAWEFMRMLTTEYPTGYELFDAVLASGYEDSWMISEMPIPWQNVMRDQVRGMGYGAWCDTEPPRRAASLGHRVKHDPPSGFTSADRWTCRCGMAVLRYESNVYGSAVEKSCRL